MIQLTFLAEYLKARLGADERGAAAVEYGLVVAMVAVTVAAGVFAFGNRIDTWLDGIDLPVPASGG